MEKLELIRGLVRPIVALALILAVIGLACFGKVEAKEIVMLAGIAMAFYFSDRSQTKAAIQKESGHGTSDNQNQVE